MSGHSSLTFANGWINLGSNGGASGLFEMTGNSTVYVRGAFRVGVSDDGSVGTGVLTVGSGSTLNQYAGDWFQVGCNNPGMREPLRPAARSTSKTC